MLLALIALILGALAAVLLLRATIFLTKYSEQWMADGRPKVFPRPRKCPRCDNAIGQFQRMRSIRHMLLGGWSCPRFGSEFDQLDNCSIARSWNAHLRDIGDRSHRKAVLANSKDSRSPLEKLIDE